MDLRHQPPRSPRKQLAGYAHLGRMLDKCRATLSGTEGEYLYPCPMDRRLLNFAGIAPEQFTEAAMQTPTDEGMDGWFRKTAKPHSEVELEQFNEMMLTHGPDTPEKWDSFKKTRDAIDASRTDITNWADLLDLEEGRAVPPRA